MAVDLATTLQDLYQRFGTLPGVQFELHQNLIAVSVSTPVAEATVFLQGAQVSHYQPAGQAPVLFLSDDNRYEAGKPLRGGIPISWPWFADLDKNPEPLAAQLASGEYPAHGFARTQDWQLDDVFFVEQDCVLLFSLAVANDVWPYASKLTLEVTVGEQLILQLSVHNLGPEPFNYTLALHSYFQVSDVTQVQVLGVEDCEHVDCLDQWQTKLEPRFSAINAETDRIYPTLGQEVVSLFDPELRRTIRLHTENLPSLVIWNPWIEKAARLSQFRADDYQRMLCLESGALLTNMIHCPSHSNQSHRLIISSH